MDSFYQRIHAPTLGSTLGTGGILIGSMIFFTVLGARPVLHEILIAVFVTVTTPVTFILLVRATLHRGTDPAPPSPPDVTCGEGPGQDLPAGNGYGNRDTTHPSAPNG